MVNFKFQVAAAPWHEETVIKTMVEISQGLKQAQLEEAAQNS